MISLFLTVIVINAISLASSDLIDSHALAYANIGLLCLPTLIVFYSIPDVPKELKEESSLHVIYFLALGALIAMNALHLSHGNFGQDAIAYSTLVAASAFMWLHMDKASVWIREVLRRDPPANYGEVNKKLGLPCDSCSAEN